jgi:uncharacterized damage-inducible protein DinB
VTWTSPEVRRPEGALDAPEAELLRGLLDWHRTTLLHKCAGLTGAQLATAPIPQSNLTLLGLIRHLTKVERIWFQEQLHGDKSPRLYSTKERPDADFEDVDAGRAEADYAALVAEWDASRKAAEGLELDTTFTDPHGERVSLRFVLVHMIGEYARHNGHADMVRQVLDGVTGA